MVVVVNDSAINSNFRPLLICFCMITHTIVESFHKTFHCFSVSVVVNIFLTVKRNFSPLPFLELIIFNLLKLVTFSLISYQLLNRAKNRVWCCPDRFIIHIMCCCVLFFIGVIHSTSANLITRFIVCQMVQTFIRPFFEYMPVGGCINFIIILKMLK